MSKKISVIIPCYNDESYIDRSIESVYIQDYNNIELIVVDDGSKDNSKEHILNWCDRFSTKGGSLKYVYQENAGSASAINTGLKLVTGEYLTLLDSDDRFLQGSLSKRAEALDNNPEISIVRSNGYIVRGHNKWLFVYDEKEKCTDIFDMLLKGETNNWAGSYLLRTEVLWGVYPDRNIYLSRHGQNLQLMLPMTYEKKCGFIDEPLMEYIQREESLSQHKNSDNGLQIDLEKLDGYFDIRFNVIRHIINDDLEHKKYQDVLEKEYLRNQLKIYKEYHCKNELKNTYKKMQRINAITVEDKILYYQEICPIVAIIIRGFRKIKRIVK